MFLASHIDTTVLADGTYELIPDSKGVDPEAHVNAATLTEDPDQSPEEPKADLASDYREGKPRTKTQYFKLCNLSLLFTCAFKLLELIENPSCIILGSY